MKEQSSIVEYRSGRKCWWIFKDLQSLVLLYSILQENMVRDRMVDCILDSSFSESLQLEYLPVVETINTIYNSMHILLKLTICNPKERVTIS